MFESERGGDIGCCECLCGCGASLSTGGVVVEGILPTMFWRDAKGDLRGDGILAAVFGWTVCVVWVFLRRIFGDNPRMDGLKRKLKIVK